MNIFNKQADLEFDILYEGICDILEEYGDDDSFGHGDYSVCPDNYNNIDFYILINRINVIFLDWILKIQAILKSLTIEWVVHVRLGIARNDVSPAVDTEGLQITSSKVKEMWDSRLLKSYFGESFKFEF